MLGELIETGRLIDAILALLAVEVVAAVLLRHFYGVGPRLLELGGTLWAGAFLLLALRFALTGRQPGLIAACLGLAFVGHLLDLAQRFRGRPARRRR